MSEYYMVTAYIRPSKLDDVKEALVRAGVPGMSVGEVRGFGQQRGHTEIWRGHEYRVDFIPKIRLEVIVAEEALSQRVAQIISESARTGMVGDGLVSVYPLSSVTQIVDGQPYQP